MPLTYGSTHNGDLDIDGLDVDDLNGELRKAWGLPVPADPAEDYAILSREHISEREYALYERHRQSGGRVPLPLNDQQVHSCDLERQRRLLRRLDTESPDRKRDLVRRLIAERATITPAVPGALFSRGPSLVQF